MKLNRGGSNRVFDLIEFLSASFDWNHGGDFIVIVADNHTAFAEHDGAFENAGVSLDETGEFLYREIVDGAFDTCKCLAAGGNDIFSSVFAAGHEVLDFGFGQQVGEDVLLNEIDAVVLEPSFGFSAACASRGCVENNHMNYPPVNEEPLFRHLRFLNFVFILPLSAS